MSSKYNTEPKDEKQMMSEGNWIVRNDEERFV